MNDTFYLARRVMLAPTLPHPSVKMEQHARRSRYAQGRVYRGGFRCGPITHVHQIEACAIRTKGQSRRSEGVLIDFLKFSSSADDLQFGSAPRSFRSEPSAEIA